MVVASAGTHHGRPDVHIRTWAQLTIIRLLLEVFSQKPTGIICFDGHMKASEKWTEALTCASLFLPISLLHAISHS